MNVCYVSAHTILEFSEIKLFHELGANVFSHGAYIDPRHSDDPKRPAIPELPVYPELIKMVREHDAKESLPADLIDWADIIVFMGRMEWLVPNWPRIKHKRVIWRTIGQSNPDVERRATQLMAQGLEVVRYSPFEAQMGNYAGDGWGIVRFFADPDEFCGWTGEDEKVIAMMQMAKPRDKHVGFTWWAQASEGFNRLLIGPHNEDTGMPNALLPFEDMKAELRKSRCYFYTGTFPAPYTLGFIEALMTGIPVVSIGAGLRNWHFGRGTQHFEVPFMVTSGINGFWSDIMPQLRLTVETLLQDHDLAAMVGKRGRELALQHFGKEKIKHQWKAILFQGVNPTWDHTGEAKR